MEKIYPSEKIYISKSKIHGFGVFANRNIVKGEIIEICPLFFTNITTSNDETTRLFDYLFSYIKNGEVLNQVIPFGYACLYNHSFNKNADWRLNEENDVFEFFAVSDIMKDDEIFICYGPQEYWDARKHIYFI